MNRLILLLLSLLPMAACSSFQEFVPRERATGESPTGKLAAEYPLWSGNETLGDVRVWCHGVWNETTEEGEELLVVHVGLEIENRSAVRIGVDESVLQIAGLRTSTVTLPRMFAPRREGSPSVAPGEAGVVHFLFEAPDDDTWASRVRQFEVEWAVLDNQGELLRQVTPFRAYRRPQRSVGFIWPGFVIGPRWGFGARFWGCW